jgi:hypothetical protein
LVPTVAIIDNGGSIPLNLARTRLSTRDYALVDAVRISIIEEFIAQTFANPGQTISQLIESPRSAEELIYKFDWNRFVYGSSGFTLLDFDLLRSTKLKHLIVVHPGVSQENFLNKILKQDLLAIRSSNFQITDKRLLVDHIRAGRYHWPGAVSYYERGRSGVPDRAAWSGQHAVLLDIAREALKSKGIPNYLAREIQEGHVFSIKRNRYLFYETGTERSNEFGYLESLVGQMATAKASPEAKRALTIWKQNKHVDKASETSTIASRVWIESFTTSLLPYKRAERAKVLKRNSPISRFIV